MEKKRVMSIAVGYKEIVGITCYMLEGMMIIENVVSKPRRGTLLEDVEEFFGLYGDETIPVACVQEGPLRAVCLETPRMDKLDQFLFSRQEGHRQFEDGEVEMAVDFASRPHGKNMLMLIVALERKKVRAMARGIQSGNGDIHLIDYWTDPLVHSRGKEESMLFVVGEKKGVRVSLWSRTFCLAHRLVTAEPKAVLEACHALLQEGEAFEVEHPKGAAIVGLGPEGEEIYESVLQEYGVLEQIDVHLVDQGQDYDPTNIVHEMAMGLGRRLLAYVDRYEC